MQEKPPMRFNLLLFLFLIGAGFGIAYGIVRIEQLSFWNSIFCFIGVILIAWLIFRSGKAASYVNAQAWAASVAEAHANASAQAVALAQNQLEVFTQATAKAEAIATATNSVYLQLAALPTPELVYQEVKKLASTGFDEGLRSIMEGLPAKDQLTESLL